MARDCSLKAGDCVCVPPGQGEEAASASGQVDGSELRVTDLLNTLVLQHGGA